MNVRMTATGTVQEVPAEYGARLIEQGKAVLITKEKPARKPAKKAVTADGSDG